MQANKIDIEHQLKGDLIQGYPHKRPIKNKPHNQITGITFKIDESKKQNKNRIFLKHQIGTKHMKPRIMVHGYQSHIRYYILNSTSIFYLHF